MRKRKATVKPPVLCEHCGKPLGSTMLASRGKILCSFECVKAITGGYASYTGEESES